MENLHNTHIEYETDNKSISDDATNAYLRTVDVAYSNAIAVTNSATFVSVHGRIRPAALSMIEQTHPPPLRTHCRGCAGRQVPVHWKFVPGRSGPQATHKNSKHKINSTLKGILRSFSILSSYENAQPISLRIARSPKVLCPKKVGNGAHL